MPTYYRDDDKPVIQFDPQLEIAPFVLFRRLREGRIPLLVDVRPQPAELTFAGAIHAPEPDWKPENDGEIVLFDDAGDRAVELTKRLQAAGFSQAKALFGGLQLYAFALDPNVVGEQTYLIRLPEQQS